MKIKTTIECVRFALELRRRGYANDIENQKDKEYFKAKHDAILEMLRKMQKIELLTDYIEMKEKYMSEKEKDEWLN